jgi:folate-binding protein YgfZ
MSDSSQVATVPVTPQAGPTALAALLAAQNPSLKLPFYAGSNTPGRFTSPGQELASLLHGAGLYDLGYRTRLVITGNDRLRWLNGMATNAIQTLPEGHGNYNFILNAQGRIQGDGYAYRESGRLLFDTDRAQADRLAQHFDRFIIMDDVELTNLAADTTGLGVAGPESTQLLASIGLDAVNTLAPLEFAAATLHGVPVTVVRAYSVLVPRFELWFAPEHVETAWNLLVSTNATTCGIEAIEALRVLEGTPLYGVDIQERNLAQETSQTRALNFSKGCYLGQEIVERIRSRTTVHRFLRQFQLSGPAAGASVPGLVELRTPGEERPVGQLTSAAAYDLPEFHGTLALGYLRNEIAERKAPLEYDGGTAVLLDSPPIQPGGGRLSGSSKAL